ncbi:hypothetical protein AAHC03_05230 [Spirometra sp. Aus1]
MPSSKPYSRSDNCKYWKREPDCASSNEKEKIMVKRNWWKSPTVNATCDKNCGKEKLIISRHWKSKNNESVIVRNDPTKRRICYKPQIHYEPTETFDYCADPMKPQRTGHRGLVFSHSQGEQDGDGIAGKHAIPVMETGDFAFPRSVVTPCALRTIILPGTSPKFTVVQMQASFNASIFCLQLR